MCCDFTQHTGSSGSLVSTTRTMHAWTSFLLTLGVNWSRKEYPGGNVISALAEVASFTKNMLTAVDTSVD